MTSLYLNAHTSARPFLPLGNLTVKSTQELEKRFLSANKLFNVSPETLKGQLANTLRLDCPEMSCPSNSDQNLRKNLWHLYFHYFRRGSINKYLADPKHITQEYITDLARRYNQIEVNLNSIDADFIYYGPWEKQFSQVYWNQKNNLKLIYQNPQVKLYKIIKQ